LGVHPQDRAELQKVINVGLCAGQLRNSTRDCTYSQSARFRLSTECLALIEELSGFPNRRWYALPDTLAML
jgi:hypothetical protein